MCLIETTMSSFMFFFGSKALLYGLMHDKGPTFNEKAVMSQIFYIDISVMTYLWMSFWTCSVYTGQIRW